MLSNLITNFQEKRKKKIADKNYTLLVERMVNYYETTKPGQPYIDVLVRAVVDIENKKAAGQIDELNQLRTA